MPLVDQGRTSQTLRRESHLKLIVFFVIIALLFVFFLSFFLPAGPLVFIRTLFLKGYNAIPATGPGVSTRDLVLFTLMYTGWYLFASIFSLEIYLVKRIILLERIRKQHAETHGLKGL